MPALRQVADRLPRRDGVVRLWCGPRRQRFSEGSDHDGDLGGRRARLFSRQLRRNGNADIRDAHEDLRITFGIAFTLLYTALRTTQWPILTYQPASRRLIFGCNDPERGRPAHVMVWGGGTGSTAAATALLVGVDATMNCPRKGSRATGLGLNLDALWPASTCLG